MAKFLDSTGLSYLIEKIKGIFVSWDNVDKNPTNYSTNLITSGGVAAALADKSLIGHTHGNISSFGTITTNAAIESGDRLIFSDSSAGNELIRHSLTFDGSTTSKALTLKGTFETFLNSETSLSKGTTSGSGNGVTDLSVSGHTITLTKGKTFEETSNKVTSISSSSTDTQYPSAKCVYDAIQAGGGSATNIAITNSEIDTIWTSAMAGVITFTISVDTYQADVEMTWEQWINSEYNIGNSFFVDTGIYANCIGKTGTSRHVARGASIYVSKDDYILNNEAYALSNEPM